MIKLKLSPKDNIQAVLDGYPLDTHLDVTLSPGLYNQKLTLKHDYLKLTGTSHDTVISFDDHALKFHADGLLMNTFRTQTVLILGDHITLSNLTIENTSGTGPKIGQAIALSSYGDDTTIQNCVLKSTQDTLFFGPLPSDLISRYDHILSVEERINRPLRQFVFDSTIIGNVDFIFGSSDAFIDHCTIISNGNGYISAPSTHPKSSFGLVFNQCRFESLGQYTIVLSRPWRSGGKVAFIDVDFTAPIAEERYLDWDKPVFENYELPYVPHHLSKPLPETMLKAIIDCIAKKRLDLNRH
ncbi:pectinesterase family protein [Acholeplasma vituli]|uniref:Pectinesterase family protein n=1 Tax=Paracholeplasma vituli TaxID=69473 RepID=A0ABT2PZ60_9MOLU|nr:pectinesterase family protein [Paracholeplasma vituli]MCU0105032.1 pectinesterase family protein [Paracholeplasma vituli]